jgi:hypothetical protein
MIGSACANSVVIQPPKNMSQIMSRRYFSFPSINR